MSNKWYHSLDDTSVCSVCSLRVKFKVDFSFGEMRRLSSIEIKKVYTHRQTKIKKSWKEFMKGTLKIPGTLQGNFNLDSLVQVIILVHSLKKGNRELMAKVILGYLKLSN